MQGTNRRRPRRVAAWPAVAALVGLSSGCADLGLPENTPVARARTAPPKPLVAATMPAVGPGAVPAPVLRVAGGEWVATGVQYRLPDAYVRPVGPAGGGEAYALAWDTAPHDRLLVRRAPGLYEELAPVW